MPHCLKLSKSIFLFLLLASAGLEGRGQKYIYEFNKNGELVSGAPDTFKAGETFNVILAFDTVLFKTQLDSFLVNLAQSRVLWTNILHKMETIAAKPPVDPKLTAWITEVRLMLVDQRDLYTTLAGLPVFQLLARYGNGGGGLARNWVYVPPPEDVIDHLKQQYRLKLNASRAPDCPLDPVLRPKDCAWYFTMPEAMPASKDIKLYLYRENGLRSLVIDWYTARRHLFPGAALTLFENAVKSDQATFNRMKEYATKNKFYPTMSPDSCNQLLDIMDNLIDSVPSMDFAKALDTVNMDALRTWVLDMSWLDKGGQTQLDPLPVTNGGFYRDLSQPTTADATDAKVMKKLEKILADETPTSATAKDYLTVWYKRDSTKNRQDSITASEKKKTAGTDPAQTAAAVLAAYGQTAVLLNFVQIPVTQKDKPPIHIREYYYNRRPDKRTFHYDYPEDEPVALAVHNRPAAVGVTVADQQTPYTEQPLITEEANQTLPTTQLGQISLTGPQSTYDWVSGAKLVRDEAASYENGTPPVTQADAAIEKLPLPDETECQKKYNRKLVKLKQLFNPYRVWDSLYNVSQIPPLFIEQTANDSPRMVTDVIYPDGSQKPPYQYKYKLMSRDTSKSLTVLNPLDSSGYRIGKRRLVELALGVAYSVTSVRQVNVGVDSANGNLQPFSTETKAQFVVGLKIHVKKIYWENNHFALSCQSLRDGTFWTRVVGFVGVAIPSPLDNVYTGAGLDLIPGMNLGFGAQWYNYNSFKVNNNQVLESKAGYRPAFYVAFTADPTLVVNIVKSFF